MTFEGSRAVLLGFITLVFLFANPVFADALQEKYGFSDEYFSAQPFRDRILTECRNVRSQEHKACATGSGSAYDACLESATRKMVGCYNAIYPQWQAAQRGVYQDNLDSLKDAIFQAETTHLKACNGAPDCCEATADEYARLLGKGEKQFRGIAEAECFTPIVKDPNGVPSYLPHDAACSGEKQAALRQNFFQGRSLSELTAQFGQKCAAMGSGSQDTPEPALPSPPALASTGPDSSSSPLSSEEAAGTILDFVDDCTLYAEFGFKNSLCDAVAALQEDESQKACGQYLSCGLKALDEKDACMARCPLLGDEDSLCTLSDCLGIYGSSISWCKSTHKPDSACLDEYAFTPSPRDERAFESVSYTITDVEPTLDVLSKDEAAVFQVTSSLPRRIELSRGMTLGVRNAIATGTNTVTLTSPSGNQVTLDPHTRFFVGQLVYNDRIDAERLVIELGRAEIALAQTNRKKGILVQTPHARVKATGTAFSVIVDAAGTRVNATQGQVSVSDAFGNQSVAVSSGFATTVLKGGSPSAALAWKASPTPSPGADDSGLFGLVGLFVLAVGAGAAYLFIRKK